MKLFLILILIILITYIGRGLSRYYIDRHLFFVSCKDFLQHLLSNISFEKDKLPSIVRKYRYSVKNKHLFEVLSEYEKFIAKGDVLQLNIKILKDEEKDKLKYIFSRLGKTDFATEVASLETAIGQIGDYESRSRLERDKYSGFYTKMALLLGLALAVLLI